jgi:hypothetical protein
MLENVVVLILFFFYLSSRWKESVKKIKLNFERKK